MSIYGQFCPVSKATEVLGERWTLLLIRELLVGSSRFSEFQRALAKMSPSLLTKRLKELEQAGLLTKTKISGQKGYEYHLTQSGRELGPLVMELAKWGMKWAIENIEEDELDVELLMWDAHRNLNLSEFSLDRAVIKIHFTDIEQLSDWWILIDGKHVDLCTENPGREPDLYITTDSRSLTQVWLGEASWAHNIGLEKITLFGNKPLGDSISHWFGSSSLAYLHPKAAQSPASENPFS